MKNNSDKILKAASLIIIILLILIGFAFIPWLDSFDSDPSKADVIEETNTLPQTNEPAVVTVTVTVTPVPQPTRRNTPAPVITTPVEEIIDNLPVPTGEVPVDDTIDDIVEETEEIVSDEDTPVGDIVEDVVDDVEDTVDEVDETLNDGILGENTQRKSFGSELLEASLSIKELAKISE